MAHITKEQRFWFGWLATNSVGWFLCLAVLFASGMATGDAGGTLPLVPDDLFGYVLMYSIIWGSLALIQAWLLSCYISRPLRWMFWWVAVCAVGWTVFWLFMYMTMSSTMLASFTEIAIGTVSLGLFQWTFLRRYLVQANRWIIVNLGTMGILFVILRAFDQMVMRLFGGGSALLSLEILLPGCLYGALTGWALVYLFKQTTHQDAQVRFQSE